MSDVRYAVEVQAGLLPGIPEQEFTRRWFVTSEEWARAEQDGLEGLTAGGSPWAEAQLYAISILNPNRVNWVRVDWVWF